MSIFNTKAVKPNDKLPYLDVGIYTLKITHCKAIQTKTGRKGFIAECEVLESDNPDVPVGCHRAWINMVPPYPGGEEDWQAAVAGFALAVLGIETSNEQASELLVSGAIDEALERAVDQDGFKGLGVKCEAKSRTTSKGATVTDYNFSPLKVGEPTTI